MFANSVFYKEFSDIKIGGSIGNNHNDFILAYASNIAALLRLRALYFLIAITVFRFKYVGTALAGVLIFLGRLFNKIVVATEL